MPLKTALLTLLDSLRERKRLFEELPTLSDCCELQLIGVKYEQDVGQRLSVPHVYSRLFTKSQYFKRVYKHSMQN